MLPRIAGAALAVIALATPLRSDCTTQVGIDLRVTGPGTPGTSLVFTVTGTRADATVYLAVGAVQAETDLGVVKLCLAWPFAILPMGPVDPGGSAELAVPLPPDLPPGVMVSLLAQAAALAPSLAPAENRTSNVTAFDVYSLAAPPFSVTGINPPAAGAGTPVQIQGSGFGASPAAVTVWFGWLPVPPAAVTDTTISLALPFLPDEEPVPVTVQVGVPRVGGGTFLFLPPPAPATGPVPGWVALGFPTLAAAMSPSLPPLVRSLAGRLARVDTRTRTALAIVPPGQEASFIAAVQAPAGAESAGQEVYFNADEGMGDPGFPDDPRRANQWNLNLAGGPLIPGPWTPLIAVVDTGVYFSNQGNQTVHQDLTGRISLPARVNLDLVQNDTVPQGTHLHGTHVTGVIAALPHNALNVTGMTFALSVLPIRILAGEAGAPDRMAQGINLAVDRGARVINVSQSVPVHDGIRRALQRAADNGVAVIKSAGNRNGGDVSYIDNASAANYPDLVLVSGLDDNRTLGGLLQRFAGSSRTQVGNPANRQVDIAAPGDNVVSLTLNNGDSGPNGRDGTSYAAPHVSAAAGIIWSWTPQAAGETASQWRDRVLDMLLRGCVRDIGPAGRDNDFGEGSLDMNGRMAFHSHGPQSYSQRVDREPPADIPPYQRINHFAGMNPRWAPDRLALVYDVWNGQAGRSELRVQAVDPAGAGQGQPAALTFGADPAGQGAFEPRGAWLCFLRRNQGQMQVWASRRDGSGGVQLHATTGFYLETPVWSHDGAHVAAGDTGSIVRIPVNRDNQGNVTGAGAASTILLAEGNTTYSTPAWSPDKNRIAFMQHVNNANGTTNTEIRTLPLAGAGVTTLTADGLVDTNGNGTRNFGPAWTPDGRRIAFHTMDTQGLPQNPQFRHRVRVVPALGGAITTIYDSGWQAQAAPMGIAGLAARHSAVDASRF